MTDRHTCAQGRSAESGDLGKHSIFGSPGEVGMIVAVLSATPTPLLYSTCSLWAVGLALAIFGWMKTIGGFRRTRYIGLERTQLAGYFVAAAYNLVRIAKLATAALVS